MTIALRSTVHDTPSFCRWVARARARDTVVYHIGNLGPDRLESDPLHQLAETILLLQETGYIVGAQHRTRIATIDGWTYLATRTGGGWAPGSVLSGRIDAMLFRALAAIRDRDADISAGRAVRNALSIPDNAANSILERLKAQQWVEPAPIKGWQLSTAGHRLLL
jgi:hypothetical protein